MKAIFKRWVLSIHIKILKLDRDVDLFMILAFREMRDCVMSCKVFE